MKNIYIVLMLIAAMATSSCKKWLEVKPKTEVEASVAFRNEQGYKDALTGVYLDMTANGLYGKELTFGMMDVLAREYTTVNGASYGGYETFNYAQDSLKTKIDASWAKMYNVVANTNSLIMNINSADPALFSASTMNIIKGEAYGLRAFLHFDLLRMFAPAPSSAGGATALAIPYVETIEPKATPIATVTEVLTKIQADLAIAAEALRGTDPILQGKTSTGYLRDRIYKFNYYAVKALQARVYLYAGDRTNALICAREVITSGRYPAAQQANIINGNDRLFQDEIIFALNINNIAATATNYFSRTSTSLLGKSAANYLAEMDNASSDYRLIYLTSTADVTSILFPTKLVPLASGIAFYGNKMPVIRVSEMYYIAAECLKDTDPQAAVDYLNYVRLNRAQTTVIPATYTAAQIQNEIFKEYRREFICEGQLFYYYKRVNSPTIAYTTATGSNAVYVFPKPDQEIEYGNR